MFWPSPEDALNSVEVEFSAVRPYTELSSTAMHDLNNLYSEQAEKGFDIFELSKADAGCCPSTQRNCSACKQSVTSSSTATYGLRHRQSVTRHPEFPR